MLFLELLMQAINASLAAGPQRYDVIIGYFKSAGAEQKEDEPNFSIDDIVPTSALPGVSQCISSKTGWVHPSRPQPSMPTPT